MLFNSLAFTLFLPLVILCYYLLPGKFRWAMLLAASYAFYGYWRVEYLGLILLSTLIDYWAGLMMDAKPDRKSRLPFLAISLISNLGLLFSFKYADFITGSLNEAFGSSIPALQWLLPVGISFYTFQTLSYSVDVYKGELKAQRHLGYFALYVTYFPQLVAGPIERYSSLGPQLEQVQPLKYDNISAGFRMLLLGFFAKMVVADRLAVVVDEFYSEPLAFGRKDALMAMIAYAFQIYGDFSGYSLIAIGSARLMGIRLMENFRTPYLAASVGEFWQRWHISLSTWFRDYVFIPAGGSRVKAWRLGLNVMLVFGLSGLWHGARWTFVAWGIAWGLAYLLERLLLPEGWRKPPKSLGIVQMARAGAIFGLATLAWVPFRSQTIQQALTVLESAFISHEYSRKLDLPLATILALGALVCLDFFFYNHKPEERIGSLPVWLRWTIYAALIYAILAWGAVQEVPFIYFQF